MPDGPVVVSANGVTTVLLDGRPEEPLRGVFGQHRTADGGVADYFVGRKSGRHYLRVWYSERDETYWLEIVPERVSA